jgi:protocatechuate 3,4-dioxygenase beta subunit
MEGAVPGSRNRTWQRDTVSGDPEPISAEIARLLAATTVTCRDWAEQLEGPYRRGTQPLRRDLVEDRRGVSLRLGLQLADAGGGPIADGEIEVWHCDALGRYSGFPPPDDEGPVVGAARAPRTEYLADQTFLRGRQRPNASGAVEFSTIYPGWYPGRTVHIHVIARRRGRTHTSQLYFADPLTDEVFTRTPYRERPNRETTNATDEIFPTGGEPAVLDVRPARRGYLAVARLRLPT